MTRYRNESSSSSSGVGIALGVIAVAAVITLLVLMVFLKRVDPGKVGVLIDYGVGSETGQPSIEPVMPGQWKWVGVAQRLAEYDISQQALTMVRAESEGQVVGDDSVVCRDKTGVQLNVDATVLWRVDTANAGKLYLLYPDKDLELIGTEVVRRVTRSVMNDVCGQYGYSDIYGIGRVDFGIKVSEALSAQLSETYLIMAGFNMGEVYLQPEQQAAVTAKSVAEQEAQEAKFLLEKRQNEADAAIAQAEGEKQVRILQAEAEAEAIRIINEQLAGSPYYIKYIYASKWDGILPATLVLANGQEFPLLGTLDLQEIGATPIAPVIPTTMP